MRRATFLLPLAVGALLSSCLAGTPSRSLALGSPVTLRVGETARVGPEGFEVTLRSMSEHSGCFSPTDCSYMIFDGTLALMLRDNGHLAQIQADLHPGSPVSVEFGGYEVKIVSVTGPRHRTATLQVEAKPEEEEEQASEDEP
jgi:hypothetical protein